MPGVMLKKHIISDHHVRILIGWSHVLDFVRGVSIVTQSIGRVAYLALPIEGERGKWGYNASEQAHNFLKTKVSISSPGKVSNLEPS